MPPFMGLDMPTTEYLISALCYETEMYDKALQMCSRVLTNTGVSRQLKDRAHDLKESIQEKKKELGEEE